MVPEEAYVVEEEGAAVAGDGLQLDWPTGYHIEEDRVLAGVTGPL